MWSPSRRDLHLPEEQISTRIQFLYYKGGALDVALDHFERNAASIFSKWQFKPRADPDVLPSRPPSDSLPRKDFLRKQVTIPLAAVTELTESLLHHLTLVSDRVKSGETFEKSDHVRNNQHEGFAAMPKQATSGIVTVQPSIEEYPSAKSLRKQSQSSLGRYFRHRSAPGAASPAPSTNAPSSDSYPDSEMVDLMAETDLTAIQPPYTETIASAASRHGSSDQTSPSEESFETPPSTPSRSRYAGIGLGITNTIPLDPVLMNIRTNPNVAKVQSRGTGGLPPSSTSNRQPRSATDHSRKLGQEPSSSKKRPYPESEPMKPPATRRVSREKRSDQNPVSFAVPTPPPDNYDFMERSMSASRSFDNIPSVSTSFTSHSTAWTSPDVSFHADSMVTSFESTTEDTDTTARPNEDYPYGRNRYKPNMSWLKSVDEPRVGVVTEMQAGAEPTDVATVRSDVPSALRVSDDSRSDVATFGTHSNSSRTNRDDVMRDAPVMASNMNFERITNIGKPDLVKDPSYKTPPAQINNLPEPNYLPSRHRDLRHRLVSDSPFCMFFPYWFG